MNPLIQYGVGCLVLIAFLGLLACNAETPEETSGNRIEETGDHQGAAVEKRDDSILGHAKTALDKAKGVEKTVNDAEGNRASQLDNFSQ